MTMQLQLREAVDKVLVAAVIGLLVSVGIGGYFLLTEGHAAFNTTSVGLNWGLPIVTYDYFIVTSTGMAFIASLPFVFGLANFYAVAKRCLWFALATFVGGGTALMLELGHPIRSLYAIPLNFQYHSPMFWKVLFVGAYVVLLLLLFYRISSAPWTRRTGRGLAIALFVALLGVTMIAGAVFGMMAMRPFWYDGMLPVYFVVEAVLGGLGFTILLTYIAYGFDQAKMHDKLRQLMTGALPKAFGLLIGVTLLIVGARAFTGLWSNADGLQVWDHIVTSPLFHLELWIGLVLPLVLMLAPATRTSGTSQVAAAVLVIVSLFIGRYEFVIGGQTVPLFKGSWVPGFIEYTPSLTEWMLLLLSFSISFLIYAAGEKLFNLAAMPTEQG